ncbi:MAG: hypothetical protein VKO21_11910 [Candidatus Sericytochromatia bacterium]|nr:hypothetical protein [Candidatus Sericytochromatia bacterium]
MTRESDPAEARHLQHIIGVRYVAAVEAEGAVGDEKPFVES